MRGRWRSIGPGLAIAATGVGAGDLMAALLAGAQFGTALLWVVVVGAALKFALNEGIARFQLATGTPLIEGWFRHLPQTVQVLFLAYLVLWSFVVAAGLMSACAIAARALWPHLPLWVWGLLHSFAAAALVLRGRYERFETVMKGLVGLMVLTLLGSLILVRPDPMSASSGLLPRLPAGSSASILSLMGGVGGSVTLLSYGYWISERGWDSTERLSDARLDLGVGYALTALFGVAMSLLAASALDSTADLGHGAQGLVTCADAIAAGARARLGEPWPAILHPLFLVGVWAAVATSTLGVWQGVPYLFADARAAFAGRFGTAVNPRGRLYRGYLLYLALPPAVLFFADRPVWVLRAYTLSSGLFLPFLAASLLVLGRRGGPMARWANGPLARIGLWASVVLFGALMARKILDLR